MQRYTGKIFYDKLEYTDIELVKFVRTELNWKPTDEYVTAYLRKPIFEKLFSIAEYTNLTKEEKTMYDSSMKYEWDNKNVVDFAREEGKQEGKHEKALDIAVKLKKEGLSIEFIVETTGLTGEEVENL